MSRSMIDGGLPQQGQAERRLIETILAPVHEGVTWVPREARAGEIDLSEGLRLVGQWPREAGLLESARLDFADFARLQHLDGANAHECTMRRVRGWGPEEHEIEVREDGVEIRATDLEGVRRAVYWIKDEMLRRGGPFLPEGVTRRKAVIQTRLSRCFFGPINRPPGNRDELLDETNYYPDAYLSRLAHDGVNALWITVKFRDTVPSQMFPEFAPESERRLAKLRETVERCARYGIRIYVFCIEPDSLPIDSPIFVRHPELKGHVIDFRAAFCTGSRKGREYLVEATRTLFAEVPGLGGLIAIPVGERFTQCSSIAQPESGTTHERCNCPRCGNRPPEDVLHETLAAMRRGMRMASPKAELIAWPYGQLIMWGREMTLRSANRIPSGVTLQHNFETGGSVRQLGKDRPLWDYWLSVVGPSPVFSDAARIASRNGTRIGAKLQVGCSHEDATVPFVPVPGLLYAKYERLHALGVSTVMQSWYFGNYPSLMTRAAGELSFAPLPRNERDFLTQLAARDWGRQAPRVVRAWTQFRRAYEQYPATHLFGYYGPVQDGLTWPLHLIPKNRPLSPTWKLDFPASGDYLADCLSSDFTLQQALTLCQRMSREWNLGVQTLEAAYVKSSRSRACRFEWNVAVAVGLQFESAAEILHFYHLREQLTETTGQEALAILSEMGTLVERECARREKMILLCQEEPTLGFHSEAEGFKFTPTLIRQGLRVLRKEWDRELPIVRDAARRRKTLFPEYTGQAEKGVLTFSESRERGEYISLGHLLTQNVSVPGRPVAGTDWQRASRRDRAVTVQFRTGAQGRALTVEIISDSPAYLREPWVATVMVDIEPRRLHPRIQFSADTAGGKQALIDDGYLTTKQPPFEIDWDIGKGGWRAVLAIPFDSARVKRSGSLFRCNIRTIFFNKLTNERLEYSWMRRAPLKPRIAWDDANPAIDYGWARIGASAANHDQTFSS